MYSYQRKNISIKNNKFIFNGHNLSNLVVVERVHRTVLPTITNENKHIPARIGSTLIDRQVGSRLITVDIRIIEDDSKSVKTLINELGSKLFTLKPATLELRDSHLYNEAMLVGDTNLETLAYTGRVSLVFECHDPFNYGQLREVNINEPFNNNGGHDALGAIEFETEATDKVSITSGNHYVENLIPKENRTFEGWGEGGSGENFINNWNFETNDLSEFINYKTKTSINENRELIVEATDDVSGSTSIRELDFLGEVKIRIKMKSSHGINVLGLTGYKNMPNHTIKASEKYEVFELDTEITGSDNRLYIYCGETGGEVKKGNKVTIDWIQITPKNNQHLVVEIDQNQEVPEWGTNQATRIRTWGGIGDTKYRYLDIPNETGKGTTSSIYIRNNGKEMSYLLHNRPADVVVVREGFIGKLEKAIDRREGLVRRVGFQTEHDHMDVTVWRPSVVDGKKPYDWDFIPIKTSTLLLEDKFLDGETVVVDLEKRYITRNGYSAMDVLSLQSDFFEIPHGNEITVDVEGAKKGTVKFRERWL